MSFIKRIGFYLFIFSPSFSIGQEDVLGFIQPQISLNYSLNPVYSHNFSVTQRVFFLNTPETEIPTRHVDLAHFSNFKIGGSGSMGFGIMYRFRDAFQDLAVNEFRLTQQVNFIFQHRALRLGHRLRTEQRLFPSRTIHRFRYRFAVDGPLQGEKLDLREFYWVGQLEGVFSAGKDLEPIYELRANGWLGYVATDTFRLQIGTEYRRVGLEMRGRSVLFLLSSVILNL